ncbi:MAG: nucleotide exchange factor GrpE, partial [Lachnospiraceae bacterium]|nr:nucleotide exchange factor GrpE [Lachnospiraceae bacterium]
MERRELVENNQELEKELEEAVETEEVAEETVEAEAAEEVVEETAEEVVEDSEEADEKKGFFGKKKDKKDKKDLKIEELEDKAKRQLAEFENFRNRTEKEKSRMYEFGARDVIEKMLPVVDNFERGLASIPEEEKGTGYAPGGNGVTLAGLSSTTVGWSARYDIAVVYEHKTVGAGLVPALN